MLDSRNAEPARRSAWSYFGAAHLDAVKRSLL